MPYAHIHSADPTRKTLLPNLKEISPDRREGRERGGALPVRRASLGHRQECQSCLIAHLSDPQLLLLLLLLWLHVLPVCHAGFTGDNDREGWWIRSHGSVLWINISVPMGLCWWMFTPWPGGCSPHQGFRARVVLLWPLVTSGMGHTHGLCCAGLCLC